MSSRRRRRALHHGPPGIGLEVDRDARPRPAQASGERQRVRSSGRSTRTTSAPSSASIIPANGVPDTAELDHPDAVQRAWWRGTESVPARGHRHPALGQQRRPLTPGSTRPCRRPAGWPARRAPGTPWPPSHAATAVAASVPSSRSSGGQVEGLADEVLAGQRLQHGVAQRDDRLGVPKQGERVRGGLAEVQGRVDEHPVRRDAGRHRALGPVAQGAQGVGEDPEGLRRVGHADGVRCVWGQAPGVRDDVARAALRRDVHEVAVVDLPQVSLTRSSPAGRGGRPPGPPPSARCRG